MADPLPPQVHFHTNLDPPSPPTIVRTIWIPPNHKIKSIVCFKGKNYEKAIKNGHKYGICLVFQGSLGENLENWGRISCFLKGW